MPIVIGLELGKERMALSSNGEDGRFSICKSEFDSPWGYHINGGERMTDGPRGPRNPTPQAPNTAPEAPTTDGSMPAGVDAPADGFEGSMVMETPDDGDKSSVVPQEPLPDNATETEKQLVEEDDK